MKQLQNEYDLIIAKSLSKIQQGTAITIIILSCSLTRKRKIWTEEKQE